MFLSYLLFELLDVEHSSTISHKNVKYNSLCPALAIVPPPPGGDFAHYDFQIPHYISHKMKYVSSLRVAARGLGADVVSVVGPTRVSFTRVFSGMYY